jgi:hypothetical protein
MRSSVALFGKALVVFLIGKELFGVISEIYEMERKEPRKYHLRKEVFDRSGKSGGVPGVDPIEP